MSSDKSISFNLGAFTPVFDVGLTPDSFGDGFPMSTSFYDELSLLSFKTVKNTNPIEISPWDDVNDTNFSYGVSSVLAAQVFADTITLTGGYTRIVTPLSKISSEVPDSLATIHNHTGPFTDISDVYMPADPVHNLAASLLNSGKYCPLDDDTTPNRPTDNIPFEAFTLDMDDNLVYSRKGNLASRINNILRSILPEDHSVYLSFINTISKAVSIEHGSTIIATFNPEGLGRTRDQLFTDWNRDVYPAWNPDPNINASIAEFRNFPDIPVNWTTGSIPFSIYRKWISKIKNRLDSFVDLYQGGVRLKKLPIKRLGCLGQLARVNELGIFSDKLLSQSDIIYADIMNCKGYGTRYRTVRISDETLRYYVRSSRIYT
jgi:hypothetical protein